MNDINIRAFPGKHSLIKNRELSKGCVDISVAPTCRTDDKSKSITNLKTQPRQLQTPQETKKKLTDWTTKTQDHRNRRSQPSTLRETSRTPTVSRRVKHTHHRRCPATGDSAGSQDEDLETKPNPEAGPQTPSQTRQGQK